MEQMNEVYWKLKKLSKHNPKNTIESCVKIQEEVGELSAELLKFRGKKGHRGLTQEQLDENILEECCDVVNTTILFMIKRKYSYKRIMKAFKRKLDKIESQIKSR